MSKSPKVGIGVIVIKDNRVLCQRRKGSHGEGTWCLPGGHLEHGESWEECAKRETLEEAGIKIANLRFGAATNDIFKEEDKHYVTIFVLADYASGEVRTMEPEKSDGWKWFKWGDIPQPLFLPMQNLIDGGFKLPNSSTSSV